MFFGAMITNFFKRKSIRNDDDAEPEKKKGSTSSNYNQSNKNVNCQMKTVRKWMVELNIDIGYRVEDNIVVEIWCPVCREHGTDTTSSFVTGSSRVKKEAVVQHKKSVGHERAMAAQVASEMSKKNQPTPIEKGFQKTDEDVLIKMDKLFRTAFYLVKKERPFGDFKDILQLQNLNGANVGETYCNDKAAKQFVTDIAGFYHDELKMLLEKADYFSVFCDGSTDKSEAEKELIMVKVLNNFYPTMKYLKLEQPPNTKAQGILEAINSAFEDFGLPDYKTKLVGFCSDGASVMMGTQRGVISLLKEQGNADWILSVWCMAHRLELAVKDAFKQTYMETVVEVLQLIYYFYKGSAKRNKEANDIAVLMEDHFLKPGKANGTRWVEHKLKAVTKLLLNWKVIVMHLMNYAEDKSNKGEDRTKAKGILAKLMQYKLVWYLYFVKDILSEVTKISLLFQRNDINVSSALTKIQSAKLSLLDMITNPGPQLHEFDQDVIGDQFRDHTLRNVVDREALDNQKRTIVQDIIDCIQNRFDTILSGDPVFVSCNIFDPKNWPDAKDGTALVQYGIEDVRTISTHFQTLLTAAGCDLVAALGEWLELKLYVSRNQHFKGVHPLTIWQRVSQEDVNRKDYGNIMKVIHLTGIYPLSNAACERGFSTMKRIKTDWRCTLNNDTMDTLMRIDIEGPKLAEFVPRPFVHRWWVSGQRIKRPNTLPYRPR